MSKQGGSSETTHADGAAAEVRVSVELRGNSATLGTDAIDDMDEPRTAWPRAATPIPSSDEDVDEIGCMTKILGHVEQVERDGMSLFQQKFDGDAGARSIVWKLVQRDNIAPVFEAITNNRPKVVYLLRAMRDVVDANRLRRMIARSNERRRGVMTFPPARREMFLVLVDKTKSESDGDEGECDGGGARMGQCVTMSKGCVSSDGERKPRGAPFFGKLAKSPQQLAAAKACNGTMCVVQDGCCGIGLDTLLRGLASTLNEASTCLSAFQGLLTKDEYEKCETLLRCRGIRCKGCVTMLGVLVMCKGVAEVENFCPLLAELGSERVTFSTVPCVSRLPSNSWGGCGCGYRPVPAKSEDSVWRLLDSRAAVFPRDAAVVEGIRAALSRTQSYMSSWMKPSRWLRYPYSDKNVGILFSGH